MNEEEIIQLYKHNIPIKEICLKYNTNMQRIYNILKRNNIPLGRKVGMKSKEEQCIKAIEEYEQYKNAKLGWKQLAEKYNVTMQTIWRYRKELKGE